MANYHFNVSVISRGKGLSLTRRANYISGQTLHDSWNKRTYYRSRNDVQFCGIFLPDDAPSAFHDLQFLCDKMEQAEARWDARTAREVKASLPNELSPQENRWIVQEYIQTNLLTWGVGVISAIHEGKNDTDPSRNNPHVHMIVSTRAIGSNGFAVEKDRSLDHGKNIRLWREQWALVQNLAYQRNHLSKHVDHESLEVQGSPHEPTIHLSRIDWQREKNGEHTVNGDKNREIHAANNKRRQQYEHQMESPNYELDLDYEDYER